MFYLKLSLMVLLYILLLPLNLVASLVLRLVWRPGYSTKVELEPCWSTYGLQTNIDLALSTLDITGISTNGDGPKFLGLAYKATGADKIWEVLESYLGPKTIYRSPNGTLDMKGILPVFSGDQLSGFLWGLYKAHQKGELNPFRLGDIKRIFDTTIFEGLPFVFQDANGKYTLGRGWIWTPWEPGHSTFDCVRATLALLNHLYPWDTRYKNLHTLFTWLGAPLRFCHDLSFWWNSVYMKSWYAEHSAMLFCSLSATLDPIDLVATSGAKQLYTRYPWNPDMAALYASYIDASAIEAWGTVEDWMLAYDVSWRANWKEVPGQVEAPKKKFFSVRSFKFKELSATLLDPGQRLGTNYMWEESPLAQNEARKGWTVDFLHLAHLYQTRTLK